MTRQIREEANRCIDYSPLLGNCFNTKLQCEYPNCDNYSIVPRNQKPKRDYVREIASYLDAHGVDYTIGTPFKAPPEKNREQPPDWF